MSWITAFVKIKVGKESVRNIKKKNFLSDKKEISSNCSISRSTFREAGHIMNFNIILMVKHETRTDL
jgi:hypothetical protein